MTDVDVLAAHLERMDRENALLRRMVAALASDVAAMRSRLTAVEAPKPVVKPRLIDDRGRVVVLRIA